MYNVCTLLRVAIVFLILLPSSAPAQITHEPKTEDVFASVHERLTDAADRALASALSEKPWMQAVAGAIADRDATATDRVIRLRAGVERVRELLPTIEAILREEGVPTELSAIVLVESGGVPTALSPKGARGLWQLMPETARRYGLVVALGRDDRTDLKKSTRAAARYLRDLHHEFGDWRLAFAAYNAGEQRVSQLIDRFRVVAFDKIARVLPRETRDYVPGVVNAIAAFGNSSQFIMSSDAPHVSRRARVVFASAEAKNQ